MEILPPDPSQCVLPPGTQSTTYAEHQKHLGYLALPSLKTPDGKVLSQWRPTPDELAALNCGQPITLVVWTFNTPLQPISLTVGGVDLT